MRGNTRQRSGHSQQSIGLPSRIAVAAARLVRRGSVLLNREAEAGWKGSPVLAALRPCARPPLIRNQYAVLAECDGHGNQIEMVLHAVAMGFGHDRYGRLRPSG
jgi:hypothetical protein